MRYLCPCKSNLSPMKTFLRILFCCVLLAPAAASAQQTAAPEREILIMDFFDRARIVPPPYAELLREHVMAGFAERGRHTLVDAEAHRELTPYSDPYRQQDEQALAQQRFDQMMEMGARYVVKGVIADYKFEHVTLPGDNKRQNIPGFQSSFRVILSAYDLKFGKQLPDEEYTLTGRAPLAEEADKAALAGIRAKMAFYINRYFKFETVILELGQPDRRGRIRELYIHSGTNMGVKPGDLFMVYEDIPVGGVMTRQKVGKLRVNDVQTSEVAKCKIASGDEEIVPSFRAGRSFVCVSDGQAFF